MSVSTSLQILTEAEALSRLKALRARQPVNFSAFYSSQLGGVVTDPALMVIPFDDHMVHRGHGIFDTAALVGQALRPRGASRSVPRLGHALEASPARHP